MKEPFQVLTHSPTPWLLAKRKPLDHASVEGRWIRLPASEWLAIVSSSKNNVAFVKRVDDAQIIIAAPLMYDALILCQEAIRYPRGITDGEWSALRTKVSNALMEVYR